MPILLHLFLALTFLLLIVFSCALFTNAIEYLGVRLRLGNNATGAILAVIGTTLPETIVPLVAIFGAVVMGADITVGKDIAQGAIIGSPFMLSTFALFLLGIVMVFKKQKILNVELNDVKRNYKYLLFSLVFVILSGVIDNQVFKILSAVFLFIFYILFVHRTLKKSKCENGSCELEELYFSKLFRKNNINYFLIYLQILVSLLLLTFVSHLFVNEIKFFSDVFKVSPVVLSLLVVPFATELPECVNSIIWIKNNKNDLAIANILGAIVFQTTVLAGIGIILTPWHFNSSVIFALMSILFCSLIFLVTLLNTKKITRLHLLSCGIFYLSYFIYLILK